MKIFILGLLIGLLPQNTNFGKEELILKSLEKHYLKSTHLSHELYLVTGLDGCGACLEHTVNFIEKNIDKKQILVIVSGQSKVQLRTKFKVTTRNSSNFIFDTLQIPLKEGVLDSGNPKLYYCSKGKVIKSETVDYKNANRVFNNGLQFLEK